MTMIILGALLVRVEIAAAAAVTIVGMLLLVDLDGGLERLAARTARSRAHAGAARHEAGKRPTSARSVASGS